MILSIRSALLALLLVLSITCVSCAFAGLTNGTTNDSSTQPSDQNLNTQKPTTTPLPPPSGFVNDFANVFTPESKQQLETVLDELKSKSEIEFAVVTVETTGGRAIADYSLALAKEWGVGPKDTSRGGGLLLLVAIKDRQWRLQVSRSLDRDLPDDVTKVLGDSSTPLYRQGKYDEGIKHYVKGIISKLEEMRKFKLSHQL
jgi:uncharacterized protein